jgi:predicted MFS family arabinose efflux permease
MVAPVPLHRNRAFQLLWFGQAASALGTNVSATAYPLLVLAATGSPFNAGVVGFLGSLPYALLQLPAGAFVDRWERKRVMLVCDAGRALTLIAVAFAVTTGQIALTLLATAAFSEGCFSVLFGLAESGAVRHVVPEAQLTAALAQSEARIRGAAFLGKPLGGMLFGLGRAVPFAADALSYLISLVTIGAIRVRFNEERTARRRPLATEIREGVSWLWGQHFLRACTLLVAASNFAFQALTLAIVVLARDHGAGAGEIGLMLGGFGAGGLLGALAAPWLQPRLSPQLVVVGANWVWAALVPPLVLFPYPYAIGVLVGGMAFVGPLWNVLIGAHLIRLTPDAMLGRVSSVVGLFAVGTIPLGSFVSGLLLNQFGSDTTILVLGAWMLATALAATINRTVRQAPSREEQTSLSPRESEPTALQP